MGEVNDELPCPRASSPFWAERLEELRTPLTGFCYRMFGSAADTDDAAQETLIRALTRADQYDASRASLSTWVHRIATNVCLDMLRSARRRAIAIDLGEAAESTALGAPRPASWWVEPMPESRLLRAADPADRLIEREGIRLAFIAVLQWLPPRQRAVLILRDVLSFSSRETAQILDTSVAAVNSALQRARRTLDSRRGEPVEVFDPDDAAQRELLERYVRAFESHDVDALTRLLHEDAVTSMPPFPWWMRGGAKIARLTAAGGACADDRLIMTTINGAPGFGQFRRDDGGSWRPFSLVVVDIRAGKIVATTSFFGTGGRFAEFGVPTSWPPER